MEVQRGVAATLRFPEADGDAVTLSDPKVTVVRDSDGATIVDAGIAQSQESGAFFTFDLKGPEIPEVDLLRVTWVDEASSIEQHVEVVGGFACSIQEIKESIDEEAKDTPTDEKIAQQRERATRDIEAACWDAFRHRYARETLNGDNSGVLILNHRRVVKTLSLSVDGEALTPIEIGELSITGIGLQRNFPQWPGGWPRGAGWPEGTNNVEITYVYGHENYPSAANPVCELATDYLIKHPTDAERRATSYTDSEGRQYRMVTAGEPGRYGSQGRRFNIPSVNAFVEANESQRLL